MTTPLMPSLESGPFGCTICTVEDAGEIVSRLLSNRQLDAPYLSMRYAILQCHDTLVWGYPQRDGERDDAWRWSSDADGSLRPPKPDSVIEARIFGENAELLVWRSGTEYIGRYLADSDKDVLSDLSPDLLPMAGELLFDEVPTKSYDIDAGHFVCRSDGGGRTTITPPGSSIKIKSYVSENQETGGIRITATRFVSLAE